MALSFSFFQAARPFLNTKASSHLPTGWTCILSYSGDTAAFSVLHIRVSCTVRLGTLTQMFVTRWYAANIAAAYDENSRNCIEQL